jgi:hypothetical protein
VLCWTWAAKVKKKGGGIMIFEKEKRKAKKLQL